MDKAPVQPDSNMPPRRSNSSAATPARVSALKHKRQRSSATNTPPANVSTPPTRSSKRIKTAVSSSPAGKPKKSKYFEHSDDDEAEEPSNSNNEEGSGYDDVSTAEDASSEPEDDEYDSDDSEKKPKRGKQAGRKSGANAQVLRGKQDLWREGVKTGLGPGKAVYIEKPKARGDGGIPYVPARLHPNTMEFLMDLKKNNDRVWLKAHDADYRTSWKDFESFVETLTEKISEIDETIPELPAKDLVFRIYRDIRFSSDPTPYKPHFSAAWSRTGRKGPYACYYVHIQPGDNCFVGCGLWHPEAEPVRLLRADIDQRPERIRAVLTDPGIRKHMFGGIGKDEKKVIRAFCKQNEENALKTKPKGFGLDHPNIELLRLRNFTMGSKVSDKDILSPQGLDRVLELVRAAHPFVAYLNSVVMPDEEAEANQASDLSSPESDDEDI